MNIKYITRPEHLDFCNTDYQRQIIEMTLGGMNQTEIAKELGKDPRRIHKALSGVHRRAALQGVAPAQNVNRQTAPGFTTKRISTAYNMDNEIVLAMAYPRARTAEAGRINCSIRGGVQR
jgi:DNA-binding CsgD family transcriptional regulator